MRRQVEQDETRLKTRIGAWIVGAVTLGAVLAMLYEVLQWNI